MSERDINSIRLTAKNPRQLLKPMSDAMDSSFDHYGDLSGIVFNVRKDINELVGGNQRTTKFQQDSEAKVVITDRLEEPNSVGTVAWGYVLVGDERFNYREVDWDQKTHRQAVYAANRIHGDWDVELAQEELMEWTADEVLETGFNVLDDREVEKLQDGWVDHDELESKDDKPKVKRYTKEELQSRLKSYRYSEHSEIIKSFIDSLED